MIKNTFDILYEKYFKHTLKIQFKNINTIIISIDNLLFFFFK